MKRIYFLVPTVEIAKTIVDELLLARIEERHIHILAKHGTPLEDLPEASLLQKSDFIPAMERGLAVGGTVGTLAGLIAVALGPVSLVVAGGGIVLAGGLAGFVLPIMFGALLDWTGVRSTAFMLMYGVVWVSLIWMYWTEVRRTEVIGHQAPTLRTAG